MTQGQHWPWAAGGARRDSMRVLFHWSRWPYKVLLRPDGSAKPAAAPRPGSPPPTPHPPHYTPLPPPPRHPPSNPPILIKIDRLIRLLLPSPSSFINWLWYLFWHFRLIYGTVFFMLLRALFLFLCIVFIQNWLLLILSLSQLHHVHPTSSLATLHQNYNTFSTIILSELSEIGPIHIPPLFANNSKDTTTLINLLNRLYSLWPWRADPFISWRNRAIWAQMI